MMSTGFNRCEDSGIVQREVMTAHGVITSFEITNRHGAGVVLSSLGAGIISIIVPDSHGNMRDVVLGYADITDYINDSPCAGKTPGRFANRIADASFTLDGNKYRLNANDGRNSLHGGFDGFQNKIWDYSVIDKGVEFTYISSDGEEGYPGNLTARVRYIWNEDNSLRIDFHCETDAPTIVNLTNHAYFNLHGAEHGDCLDHILRINGSRRLPSDIYDIPTGEILPVEGTPFDFSSPKQAGKDIMTDFENLRSGKGYNHYFFIDRTDDNSMANAATLYDPRSGITLKVDTTLPGFMLYTGNWLAGSPAGKGGVTYRDHDGIAIECQFPPDAPNRPAFPSPVLRPHEHYRHTILYRFS